MEAIIIITLQTPSKKKKRKKNIGSNVDKNVNILEVTHIFPPDLHQSPKK